MRSPSVCVAALAALLVAAVVALACGDSGARVTTAGLLPPEGTGGTYLALGDSIAAGQGASDASSSYVALVAGALRERFGPELEARSLAVGGHTTQDVIDQQLTAALDALRDGDVRLVTITIAGNDLYQYSADAPCLTDPSDPACPLRDGLVGVEERLDLILGQLREAGPETAIVIQAYPNLFSGTGHDFERPAEIAFGLLNEVIIRVAGRHDVLVADPRLSFAGLGGSLTHTLDPTPDFHPNDAGHRAIADAFLEVLGLPPAQRRGE